MHGDNSRKRIHWGAILRGAIPLELTDVYRCNLLNLLITIYYRYHLLN